MSAKVLITGALHPDAVKAFEEHSELNVKYIPDCSRELLYQELPDTQVLVTRSETAVDQELLEKATELKVVARAAVGVGNIDIDAATKKGVLVMNTPGRNTNSAAELTIGSLLGMMRNLPQSHTHLKKGGWDRHRFSGRELRHKKIGLIGLGHVGHRVARFCKGFEMEVQAWDPYLAPAMFERYGVRPADSMQQLLEDVDILSVHVPLNKETTGMIGARELGRLKPGSWVVNAARGGIIDENALVEALESGHVAGAAVDTWVGEPMVNSALRDMDQVWCSPHIGASTLEAQKAIGETVFEQVVKSVRGGVVDYPVNLPLMDIVSSPLLKPYAVLAQKLGSLSSQLVDFQPVSAEVSYRGDLAGVDQGFIKLAFMKGFASHAVDDFVSYVNAENHFKHLGVVISEREDPDFDAYRSAIKVVFSGPKGESLAVGGTVFDQKYPRVSLIDEFYFEVEPNGEFLVVENHDRVGVVGKLGVELAKAEINIDSLDLARNARGGKAMALVKVDTEITAASLETIRSLDHVISARRVSL